MDTHIDTIMTKHTRCIIALALSALLLPLFRIPARGQIYTSEVDPGWVKWSYVTTPSYKIIYPAGMDSLAYEYGKSLERFRMSEGWSSGMIPGQGYRSRTPVVLHAFTANSNGSVAWAPKRMELYTLAEQDDPEPVPWIRSLVVHESRHLSQMQLGYKGFFRYVYWLTGETIPAALSAVYPNTFFLEGDAVVAETALTGGGRGRNAQFLSYYMAAFDGGDYRNFYKWRWGSYRRYAPNHYAVGYLTIAGTRYFYDDPLFTRRYFGNISRKPWRFFNFPREVKKASGMSLNKTFVSIADSLNRQWSEERALRGEMTSFETVSPLPDWHTVQQNPLFVDGTLYAIQNSLVSTTRLVSVDSTGRQKVVRPFSSSATGLQTDGRRLFWSEVVPSRRWGLMQSSRIRYMDLKEGKGRIVDLTREGRYYSPAPSPDGKVVAAINAPTFGGTRVELLDKEDGHVIRTLAAPDSVQMYSLVWAGGGLYGAGVSEGGEGIYRIDLLTGSFDTVLPPVMTTVHTLREHDGDITFTSDRTGVQEIYLLSTKSGEVRQLTVSPYGNRDARFAGDTLYSIQTLREGDLLVRSVPDGGKVVEFSRTTPFKMADALTAQEKELARKEGQAHLWPGAAEVPVSDFSEPRPYSKAAHLFRIHSWLPVYTSVDEIASASLESVYNRTSLGATLMYQNTLGTSYGTIGYFYAKDPTTGNRRHGGHFDITYTGLYPVIKASLNVGERDIRQYRRIRTDAGEMSFVQVTADKLDCPLVSFALESYVPLNFSSGGWTRGLIPRAALSVTNDRYSKSVAIQSSEGMVGGTSRSFFTGVEPGDNILMKSFSLSVRGYVMEPKAPSMTYPRLGISAEIGARARLGLSTLYSPSAYLHMYGYLPGLAKTQGLRLTATYQHQFRAGGASGENVVYIAPRGFSSSGVDTFLAPRSTDYFKMGFDYSIPIYLGDISFLSPVMYIKNFELRPQGDLLLHWAGKTSSGAGSGNLFSVGAEFLAKSANFIWIPYETTMGIRVGYNGGSSYGSMEKASLNPATIYVEAVFSVDL